MRNYGIRVSTYSHITRETTVCSSKEQALQFAYGLDFLSIQAYRLWMEYPSREKDEESFGSPQSSVAWRLCHPAMRRVGLCHGAEKIRSRHSRRPADRRVQEVLPGFGLRRG